MNKINEEKINLIINKKQLNETTYEFDIYNPYIAVKALAGEFIIIRPLVTSERIPLTIASYDRDEGIIKIIFQAIGRTTIELSQLHIGDKVSSFVGPLGNPTKIDGLKKVCIIGGGVGCAIAYPVAQALAKNKADVYSIIGFRNKDLIILEDEFKKVSKELYVMTDDGSNNHKGLVTDKLEELILKGETFDEIITIGPLIMMKFVTMIAKKYNIKVVVSMNSLMIDGTGMCGCCRLTVGNKMKFACIDGPDFDGYEVDFDEAISRSKAYLDFEKREREAACNLYKGAKNE